VLDPDPEDYDRHLAWVRQADDQVLAVLDRLPDPAFAEPSLLPGWSRAHVAAHLAHNAEGLARLATWAATGVETPMYPSAEARAADIEATAAHRPADVREKVAAASTRLVLQLDDLPPAARSVQVRGLLPPPFLAGTIPWQRVRELWVHLVDLDAGVGLADLPVHVQEALLDEAAQRSVLRGVAPAIALVDDDGTWWQLGEGIAATTLTGPRPALLAWLTGRPAGAGVGPDALVVTGDGAPDLPPRPAWP
jgi:maleylpyruvate isomerase